MKRMLFNATQQEELRVAIVDGQKLIDIDIETAGREQRKSNIYKGVITRIEPSLEACFVNYGEERHGFLPFKEVARGYFRDGVDVRNASIREALCEGQEIMVQVEKEERGNKGAALTSFVSLAGRYLVLMPNNPRGGGVSRRVEGEDRQELRETMDKLDLPQGMSVIARTAGIGRNVDELQWDLNYLMQLWNAIDGASKAAPGAFLIYQESSLVIRAIRDYFQPDIGEILIDTDDIFEQAQQFMSHVMPDMVHRVKRYRDDVPLFSRFQIEHQIESAYSRTVPLPSGGAIVIDHTEALVSVDVNSARATRGSDIETTAFNTNLEAAEEVARQLRLRDLGGLIVIDFIDMENAKNQREIENRLKDALHYDRARVQMGKISRFGLMELSRQRLRPSLSEGSHVTCPRCNGTGHIRDTDSSALQVLRIIQEEAMKENSAAIHVQVPVDVAAFLLNEKRGEILKIETRHRVSVVLIPNKHLETPHYKLERIKHDDPRLDDLQASYTMAEDVDTDVGYSKRKEEERKPRQEAVVKSITPDQPAPVVERRPAESRTATEQAAEGFLSRLLGLFRKKPAAEVPATRTAPKPKERDRNDRGGRRTRGGRNRGRDKEERAESRESRDTKETREARDTKEARLPKPQREAREGREPRESGEPREPRRDRHRQSRDDKRHQQTDEKLQPELPVASAAPIVATAALTAEAPVQPDLLSATGEETSNEANGDQPRRRRRRGGRNRNRRDRDPSDTSGAESDVMDDDHDDAQAHSADTVHQLAEQGHASDTAHQPAVERTGEHASTVAVPEAFAGHRAADAESTVVAEPMAPVALEAVETAVNPVAETAPETAAAAADIPAETVTPTSTLATTPQPAHTALAQVAAGQPSVSEAASTGASHGSSHTSGASESLEQALATAGLMMATTDPEKLRKVQQATASVEAAPRAPRERKPMPSAPSEPLVQVETRG
ncbi:MAG: Rne/Rng family ribonuclease [Oxalobacteraceae bacterium]